MKEDDEADDDVISEDENPGEDRQGLLSGSGLLSSSGILPGSRLRKNILRRLSLGLVIYGVVVMVVCLSMNIFLSTRPNNEH